MSGDIFLIRLTNQLLEQAGYIVPEKDTPNKPKLQEKDVSSICSTISPNVKCLLDK